MYTQTPVSSAPLTPQSTHGSSTFPLDMGGHLIGAKGQRKKPNQRQANGSVQSNSCVKQCC
eukprot:12050357-Karenia_brevis.AAC.1